jgi:protein AroM
VIGAISIGAISIGQSPRPDLLEPLRSRLPADRVTIVELGALDGLERAHLPLTEPGGYPLTTRMRDGTRVTVDEAFLSPLVQTAIDEAEGEGCVASILLCAGGFEGVHATRPLVRPFELGAATLRSLGFGRVAVVVPIDDQVEPSRCKWSAAGFDPSVIAATLGEAAAVLADQGQPRPEVVVLDFVGHPEAAVGHLREFVEPPVLDLGELAAVTLASTLGP